MSCWESDYIISALRGKNLSYFASFSSRASPGALVWIGIYCVLQSLAGLFDEIIGMKNAAGAVFCIIQSIALFSFIRKNRLSEKYGLCRPSIPARRFLYYAPLILLATNNLWNGVVANGSWFERICHFCLMLCVGFTEEVIFRGFLFRALAKDNVKTAMIVSGITFGIGHLLNLVNGSGMELAANLSQVAGATAFGFLFVILFYRSGSLLPCIMLRERSIFDHISAVYQDYGRYKLTLAENVYLSDAVDLHHDLKKPDMERICRALKWADVRSDIRPDQMVLGKEFGGRELSGGQWQRIALARSCYRRRTVLLFDESTAAIDPLEETKLYRKLNELAGEKTVILVTHRLGTVRNADKIIVMKNGRIAEMGNFDELMRLNGVFHAIWSEQTKWYKEAL